MVSERHSCLISACNVHLLLEIESLNNDHYFYVLAYIAPFVFPMSPSHVFKLGFKCTLKNISNLFGTLGMEPVFLQWDEGVSLLR